MQGQSYKDFVKLSKDRQYQLPQQQKQTQPSPIPELATFPQIGFLPLTSTQDKAPIKLATYRYAAQNTKGVVIFFHSIGYHMGIFANTAKFLAAHGYTFVGYDQRGHGKSEGQKGYFDDYKLVMKDANTFIGAIFKAYPNVPIFLMGHGLGCLLSIVFSQEFKQFKFAGLILGGPSLKKPANSKVLSAISDFALKLMPNSAGIFPLVFQNVCRNPTASNYLKNDPNMYHGKVCVGTLTQMMEVMEKNQQKNWPKMVTPPLVIIQGQYDKVADPINSINFYQSVQTKDKDLWWYPNMWNNFFLQPEINEIHERLVKWLDTRSS